MAVTRKKSRVGIAKHAVFGGVGEEAIAIRLESIASGLKAIAII